VSAAALAKEHRDEVAPGAYHANIIPFTFQACAKHGPIFLHESTTIANTGIPGVDD
jgi:hypothetical protein